METLAEQAARIAPDALLPLLRGEPGDFEEWEEIAALLAGETRLEPGTGSWDGPAVSGLQLHRLRDGSALWVVDDEFTGGRAGGAATEEAAYRLLVELATECDGWEGAPDAVFRPADIYVAPPPQVYPPGAGSIEEIRGFLASVGDRPTPDQSPTRHLSLAGYAGLCARTGHRNHAVWVDPCGYPDPDLPAPAPVATAPGDCNWWRAGLPGWIVRVRGGNVQPVNRDRVAIASALGDISNLRMSHPDRGDWDILIPLCDIPRSLDLEWLQRHGLWLLPDPRDAGERRSKHPTVLHWLGGSVLLDSRGRDNWPGTRMVPQRTMDAAALDRWRGWQAPYDATPRGAGGDEEEAHGFGSW